MTQLMQMRLTGYPARLDRKQSLQRYADICDIRRQSFEI